ncbi:MAG: sensor histidine kinase [Mucilaginibacter sp.]|nr:sensor histidine kinase [Mucilaginibacter sp.]
MLHALLWLIYIVYEFSALLIIYTPKTIILYYSLISIISIGFFYFCAEYLFPFFYDKKKIIRFILLTLLATTLYVIILILFNLVLIQFKPDGLTWANIISWPRIYGLTVRVNWYMIIAAVYWRAKKLIVTETRSNELLENYYLHELQEEELKQAIATAELAYIRAQINPHFLFNTLNFLYSNVYLLSKDIAKSVLMLSDMMRFVIENNEGGTTDLTLEIKHIENYIKLNQQRLNNNLHIDFEHTGISGDKKIVPFILMTLVENAFKHGDLTDAKHPLKIQLDIQSENIRFCITNKISVVKLHEQQGTGMSNLRKCLELFYDDKFKLTTQNNGQYYSCALDIELNEVSVEAFQFSSV